MPNTRIAGKRGRLAPLSERQRLAIRYIHEYGGGLPAASYPVDVTGGIGKESWLMLGNGPDPTCTVAPEGVGDCTFCGREHYAMAKAAAYKLTETFETADQLVTEYLAYDNSQDQGAVIATLLHDWYTAGKIAAFAPVDHTDPSKMDAAMQEFHGLYIGVDLTDDADDLFNQGLPWTVAGGQQPDPSEGHCILKVKADGQGTDGYITWGAEQDATEAWSAACVDEAWVIILSEDEMESAALAELRADIDALGGTGGTTPPAPAPAPVPVPAPPSPPAPEPAPVPPDPGGLLAEIALLARTIAADADRDIAELVAFLHQHGL